VNPEIVQPAPALQRCRQHIAGEVLEETGNIAGQYPVPAGRAAAGGQIRQEFVPGYSKLGRESPGDSFTYGFQEGVVVRVNKVQAVHADVDKPRFGAFDQGAFFFQRVQQLAEGSPACPPGASRPRRDGTGPAEGACRAAGLRARETSPAPASASPMDT